MTDHLASLQARCLQAAAGQRWWASPISLDEMGDVFVALTFRDDRRRWREEWDSEGREAIERLRASDPTVVADGSVWEASVRATLRIAEAVPPEPGAIANRRRSHLQRMLLVAGTALRAGLFAQFWTGLLGDEADPITGEPLDGGAALAALIAVGLLEVTLIALTWRNPGGTASGVLVLLSAFTAVGSFAEGDSVVGLGYCAAALCFLIAPWVGRRRDEDAGRDSA